MSSVTRLRAVSLVGALVTLAVSISTPPSAGAATKARSSAVPKSCPNYRFEERGRVAELLPELSGWALSKRQRDVLWAHNDSGEDARLLAVSAIDGSLVGDVAVGGVTATDWEDIATYVDGDRKSWIVIADTGDNAGQRETVRLVLVPEPELSATTVEAAGVVTVTWADGPHDVEALIVDPLTGDAVLIGKRFSGEPIVSVDVIARRSLVPGAQVTSTKVGNFRIPFGQPYGPTGASISATGTTVGLVFYANLTLTWTRSRGASVAATIMRNAPCVVRTGFGQYESVAIADNGAVLVATEGRSVSLRAYVPRPR